MKITVGIPTKDRYDMLDKALLSIALQTVKPFEVIVVDDSVNPVDVRTLPHYEYILNLFLHYNIKWRWVWGVKKGQHYSHQYIQEAAEGDWIFRMDDDCVAEADTLDLLTRGLNGSVGAIAPSVLIPNPDILPQGLRNTIENLNQPNMQWFKGAGIHAADHLYSCFLHKKGIVNYDLNLSTVAHREETIFTHSIKRAGYKLLVNMNAKVWHFRANNGGIRSFRDESLWAHDEKIFQGYLGLWGVNKSEKFVVIKHGLGDHYAFKNILPELTKKYDKIKLAVTFPLIFFDEDMSKVQLMSIAEAELLFGNIEIYNIYGFMERNNWKKNLVEAFRAMYL